MRETAIAAARAAGQVLKDRFARPHEVTSKGLRDVVTEADLAAQQAIVTLIHRAFPGHQILTEEAEGAFGTDSAHRWFVDPLDGTTNYARGIPYFSVSIAAECEGQLRVGVVYEPLSDRLFYAALGEGAYLNGVRLHVSERSQMIDALLDLGWARSNVSRRRSLGAAEALAPLIGTVRTMGSAALGLAAIAAGWEDVYYHPELSPWDMAAGVLLVREAGGEVSGARGEAWHPFVGTCLATNGLLHRATLERILSVVAT